ncbi:hypothetical protein [Nitrogeniibacter aestuarii]|uniref:hypothetical protein n=1 Tax=Nitrogeniibacter aestuarii TaxID=2815343 RepID=UPI001E59C13B|nr:hypothetical protein [Nitrogeniibacter aestuarii]
MKTPLILTAAIVLPLHSAIACDMDANHLGARYESTVHSGHTNTHADDHAHDQQVTMTLWRNGKRVAHEFPKAGITEIWWNTPNGFLAVTRNFDSARRSIEYAPMDLNRGKGDSDWSVKYQLVSNTLKNKMQLTRQEGSGCEKIEHYTLSENGITYRLAWQPARQLVQSYEVERPNAVEHWTLQDVITDTDRIAQSFERRDAYQSTDYADIGDNESDPFLLKLVSLGFVTHASGFYNADGTPIDDGHGHGHEGHAH